MFIEIYDSKGNFVRKQPAGNRKGVNVVQIQTSIRPPKVPSSPALLQEAAFGPELAVGDYTIKLIKGEDTISTKLTLQYNPASQHSVADREERRNTMMEAYDLLETLAYLDNMILEIGAQTREMADSVKNKGLRAKSFQIATRMDVLHESISATQPGEGGLAGQVRLREKIAEVYGAVAGYDGKPTNVQKDALAKYAREVEAIQQELNALLSGELDVYNKALIKQGLPPVVVTTKAAFMSQQ
jgi:hypothetical protein